MKVRKKKILCPLRYGNIFVGCKKVRKKQVDSQYELQRQ